MRQLNRIMIVVAVMLGVVLIMALLFTNRNFYELEKATERYIQARKDVADIQAGSDYLTDRVRTFVVTGDPESAKDFFYEVEMSRRRDLAVESMKESISGSDGIRYLSTALQISNELAEIERYAMRLAAAGNDLDIETLPSALGTVTFTVEDEALSAEEKLVKAREMLDESRGERLTAREMDVLECVAKGFSNQDIAKALGLSEKTVKNHMTRVLRKLKVEDRTQALVYVLKNKIISLD